MARWLCLFATLFVLSIASQAWGEQSTQEPQRVDPDLVMAIQSTPGSPDLVRVTVVSPNYAAETLVAQIESLAASFGVTPVALQILPATSSRPLSAVFSIPGLVSPGSGDVQLQAIVRAFLTGEEDSPQAFSITFHGLSPMANTTLASYRSPNAVLQAYYDQTQQTLEYRVLALTENPDDLVIPSRFVPETYKSDSDDPLKNGNSLLVGLMILSGAAAGALVYFALLGRQA